MPAYFVCQVFVTDAEAYEDYRYRVPPTIEKYGGKALARGFTETLEGDDPQSRMVIIEFEDETALKRWYESDDVRPLNALRQKAARTRGLMVPGA
jgi:uncharacterized protein (DUF1330 family)